ncbi:MAG: PilZ domain-containing protein [Spirochaetales bacterium]|nr:PilZ domain-containing protein [Spirochaetales bacterium]
MWILIGIAFIGLLAGIAALRKMGGGNFPWVHFYAKGRESGFTFHEIGLLRKIAVENRLENPTSLFWSIKQLDRSIRGTISKLRAEGKLEQDTFARFLSKLFDFRRRVELNLPKYKLGLKSSRKIVNHQRMKLTLEGVGTYSTSVVENLRRYLAISYPEGPVLPPGFSWKGQKAVLYFWRADDAGYVFDTKVIEDFLDREYPILHVSHSDNLVRSQKRQSVRVEVNLPASLYTLRSINEANENEEQGRGLKCRLVDISSDGAALLIGGRAKIGLTVKLQFHLANSPIVMCGVVKGVSFNQKKNQSILHVQSVPLSLRQKNTVLSFVYNLFNERGEDQAVGTVSKY